MTPLAFIDSLKSKAAFPDLFYQMSTYRLPGHASFDVIQNDL